MYFFVMFKHSYCYVCSVLYIVFIVLFYVPNGILRWIRVAWRRLCRV